MRPFCGAVLGLVRTPEWMREGPPDLSHSFPPHSCCGQFMG